MVGAAVLGLGAAEAAAPAPAIRGPRTTTDRTPTFRFSWGSRRAVRFACSIDTQRLKPCPSVYTPRLSVGRHVLRVRAADRRGHRSAIAKRVISVRRAGPRVRATIRTGGLPWGIADAGGSLWVADFQGRVIRIDPGTARVSGSVSIGGGTGLVTAGPAEVWATSFLENGISRIDVGAGRVSATAAVGPGPGSLVFAFGSIWVANKGCTDPAAPCPGAGTLARLDPATMAVVATIPVGREPRYLAAGGGAMWVTNFYSDTLLRIDPATNAVTATVGLPGHPNGVAVSDDSVFVAGYEADRIWRFDISSLRQTAAIRLPGGSGPEGIGLVGADLWTANARGGSVSRVRTTANRLLSTTPVGLEPRALAFAAGSVWVTNLRSGTVSRVTAG